VNLELTTRPLAASDRAAWDELWAIYLDFYGETLSAEVTEATWRRVLHREDGLGGIVVVLDAARRLYDRVAHLAPYVRYEVDLTS
jgi:hypothetical protein